MPTNGRAEIVKSENGRARECAGLVVLLKGINRAHDLGGAEHAAGEDVWGIGHRSQIAGAPNDGRRKFRVILKVLGNQVVIIDHYVRTTGGAGSNATLPCHACADGVETEAERGADSEIHDGGGDFNDPHGHIQTLDGGFIGCHIFANIADHNGISANIRHDGGLIC